MRPFARTLPLAEAMARLRAVVRPVQRRERVPLDSACGRVVAETVVSPFDVPPFDRALMDGYAVRAADTALACPETPALLVQAGRVFAGEMADRALAPGSCCEIATGAPMLDGADAVVMVEDTWRGENGLICVRAAVRPGQNVGRRGADVASGETVLEAGVVLTPARVGVLAALGRTDVTVYARPNVLIASTGNEVVPPGRALAPGQIFDINRFTLPAIVAAHGGQVTSRDPIPDNVDALREAIDAGADADLIIISGGSSVGERDLLLDAVRDRGEVVFHGIAVKPGKPALLAVLGTRLLLGMPGNPTSCLSNAYILLVPLLRGLAGLPEYRPETRRVPLAQAIVSAADRHQFYSVRIEAGRAVPAFKGSGAITSLSRADGYIEIPAGTPRIDEGTLVDVTIF